MSSTKRSYFSIKAHDNISVEIKDEKGLVINKFNSISSCVKFYGLSISTLDSGLRNDNNVEIIIKNKPYNLSLINSDNNIASESNSVSVIPTEEVDKDISNKALEKRYNNAKEVAKENSCKGYERSAVYIYERCTKKRFKLIGSFLSPKRAASLLGVSKKIIIKYKNSGLVYEFGYKFRSNIR